MLKKGMLYLMMFATACRFLAMTFVFSTGIERLPYLVYASTGIVILFGIFLICKNIIKWVSQKELVVYYLVSAVSVIFNLIFMKISSRAELTMLDFMVIGTIMDIVINVTLVALTVRESKYVRVRVKSDS